MFSFLKNIFKQPENSNESSDSLAPNGIVHETKTLSEVAVSPNETDVAPESTSIEYIEYDGPRGESVEAALPEESSDSHQNTESNAELTESMDSQTIETQQEILSKEEPSEENQDTEVRGSWANPDALKPKRVAKETDDTEIVHWAHGVPKAENAKIDGKNTAMTETLPEESVSENVALESPEKSVTPHANETENTPETDDHTVQNAIETSPSASDSSGSWTTRLARGLSKSRDQMAKSLASVFGGGKIDEDLYEELETVLLTSDMGIEATEYLMNEVRRRVSLKGLKNGDELRAALKEALYELLHPLESPLNIPDNGQPFVIMMAGINGAGKTTSIGKLAKYFQSQGKSVILAAGDTFRAAAREQLQEWGVRNGVNVVSQASGDSAAVCFDALESAKAKGIDIVLADTAGRLPTQLHLMEEIKKVKRVLQKSLPDAPHEIIVVLDANIGQNAINQVVAFDDALGVTGLIVTKLDGTARGGVLAALASNRAIPVRYIGVGEGIDDLRPFDARAFVDALLSEKS